MFPILSNLDKNIIITMVLKEPPKQLITQEYLPPLEQVAVLQIVEMLIHAITVTMNQVMNILAVITFTLVLLITDILHGTQL